MFEFNLNLDKVNYDYESTFLKNEFECYKKRYNLNTTLDIDLGSISFYETFAFFKNENLITIKTSRLLKPMPLTTMIRGLLHELGHAIQFQKMKDFDGYFTKNFNYLWNMEVAAEKFSIKEYQRRYLKTLGPPVGNKQNPNYYATMHGKHVKPRTMKTLTNRMKLVYARSG